MMNIFKRTLASAVEEEDTAEREANDMWAASFLDFRLVRIPNRDSTGRIDANEPSRLVKIDWHCPFCGKLMDEPKLKTFSEGSVTYQASVWNTSCGCQVKYINLNPIDGELPNGYQNKG